LVGHSIHPSNDGGLAYALTDAERHCRLDSFAMADQASALLRVDKPDGYILCITSQLEYSYLVGQFTLIRNVAFVSLDDRSDPVRLDDMFLRDESPERIRTGELTDHQRVEIHSVGLRTFASIDQ
jgi:hypothetical protein